MHILISADSGTNGMIRVSFLSRGDWIHYCWLCSSLHDTARVAGLAWTNVHDLLQMSSTGQAATPNNINLSYQTTL